MRLTEGDKIITGPNSSAKIELENENAVLTLSENTRIYLSELKGQGDDQQTSVNLQAGGIGSKVKKALSKVSRFNIKTPTAAMGVRGTQFYTQYRDGEVDIRVLNGLVDVTIGANNAPVDEGAGDDPGAPPTDGTGLGVTDPDDPGTNTGAGGAAFTYTLGAMQQMGFNEGASPDQLGGLAAEPFSLDGLEEPFIGDLEDQAASDPDSVPPGLLDGAPAARDQAREKSKERQGREGQAPREQDEKPGERGREIARSTPNTGNGQAPNIIDQTPQTIPPGGTPGSTVTPPAPPPAPTYDDDDGGDDYYEPTPPPASCPTGSHKVTFSVVGGNGSIYAALIENAQAAVSGNCYPAGTEFVFTATPSAVANYVIKEWRINGDIYQENNEDYYEGSFELSSPAKDVHVTVEFMIEGQQGGGEQIDFMLHNPDYFPNALRVNTYDGSNGKEFYGLIPSFKFDIEVMNNATVPTPNDFVVELSDHDGSSLSDYANLTPGSISGFLNPQTIVFSESSLKNPVSSPLPGYKNPLYTKLPARISIPGSNLAEMFNINIFFSHNIKANLESGELGKSIIPINRMVDWEGWDDLYDPDTYNTTYKWSIIKFQSSSPNIELISPNQPLDFRYYHGDVIIIEIDSTLLPSDYLAWILLHKENLENLSFDLNNIVETFADNIAAYSLIQQDDYYNFGIVVD